MRIWALDYLIECYAWGAGRWQCIRIQYMS